MDMDTADVSNKLVHPEGGLDIEGEELEDDDAIQPKINVDQILKDSEPSTQVQDSKDNKPESPISVYSLDSSNSSQEDSNSLKRKQLSQDELVNKKPRISSIMEVDEYDSLTESAANFLISSSALKDEIIKKYLEEHKVSFEDKYKSETGKCFVKLKFENAADGINIFKNLYEQGRKTRNLSAEKLISLTLIDGSTLIAARESSKDSDNEDEKSSTSNSPLTSPSVSLFVPGVIEGGPLGTYGLKPSFLKYLGITPPLSKWITVANVRCDKSELRDVMEMAGKVLYCNLINKMSQIAEVQYSHALEAVQAISMFNDQMLFGVRLDVRMDRFLKNQVFLPNGLCRIGPGLGWYGRPIRDIAEEYKFYTYKQKCSLNPIMFCKSLYDVENIKDANEIYVSEFQTFIYRHGGNTYSNYEDQSERSRQKSKSPVDKSDQRDSDNNDETENTTKSNDLKEIPTISRGNSQFDTSGQFTMADTFDNLSRPISLSQNFPVRSQMFPSAPIRPPGPRFQYSNNQYSSPFQPGPTSNPNNTLNQHHLGTFGPTPYMQQTSGPKSSGSVQSSMGVSGPFKSIAPVGRPGPGPIRGPMPVPGPRPIRGPIPVPEPGHIRGPIPVPGPGPIQGPIPVPGPGPLRGPMPVSGPIRGPIPVAGSGPLQGPRPEPGPEPIRGPNPAPGSGPIRDPMPVPGPGPIQGPMQFPGPGPIQGPRPDPGPGPMRGSIPIPGTGLRPIRPTAGVALQFTNLPPSTTFSSFCERLAHCGQVMSLQFTTPGCAVVTYDLPSHALRCFQTYNGMTVEGCRINVTIM